MANNVTVYPPTYYLGIDPGATGGAVLLAPYGICDVIQTERFTLLERWLWLYGLRPKHALGQDNVHVVIEQVHAMPSQALRRDGTVGPRSSAVGNFNLGRNFGEWMGMLKAFGSPVNEVTPGVWKRFFNLVKVDKKASRDLAQSLWPTNAEVFRRVKDDGMAEAALMAEYGRRKAL